MNMYWNVYRGLEKELLGIADVIHIDDKQSEVYSVKIASLLLRTAVEIEAISKKLYQMNGGTKDLAHAYFDFDCIKHLNQIWGIESRVVTVASPYIYLSEPNRTFAPLKDCSIKNDETWKGAYQAVKHNREENLEKGNIINFIKALGALFILNVYYRDETVKIGTDPFRSFDCSRGSEIFSLLVDKRLTFGDDGKENVGADSDQCAYIIRAEPDALENVTKAIGEINKEIRNRTEQIVRSRLEKGEHVSDDEVRKIADSVMVPTARDKYRILHAATQGLRYVAELNKSSTAAA